MPAMSDLITWLRSQLDEDENDASTSHQLLCDIYDLDVDLNGGDPTDPQVCTCRVRRRLLDVASKRAILDTILPAIEQMDDQIISEWGSLGDPPCDEVSLLPKLLAAPYADRPGYLDEWWPPGLTRTATVDE